MKMAKTSKPLRPFVKICGITNWPDAKLAVDLGADVLGFNFFSESPRYITPVAARRIIAKLPDEVVAAGIFVSSHPFEIGSLAMEIGLEIAQLHGDEEPRRVEAVAAFVDAWKAFQVTPEFKVTSLSRYQRMVAGFVLDGFSKTAHGGTGNTFDWKIARRAGRFGPILLAGGLHAGNVVEAIRVAQPDGIDVCSGVELRPGKKSAPKMRDFMNAVECNTVLDL